VKDEQEKDKLGWRRVNDYRDWYKFTKLTSHKWKWSIILNMNNWVI
jgi:hypothetical protein